MSGNLNRLDPSVYATWPTPNYVNPIRRSWMPLYAGILQGVSSLIVITRLWLRARNKAGPFGLDDVCICDRSILAVNTADRHAGAPPAWLAGINSIHHLRSLGHRKTWLGHPRVGRANPSIRAFGKGRMGSSSDIPHFHGMHQMFNPLLLPPAYQRIIQQTLDVRDHRGDCGDCNILYRFRLHAHLRMLSNRRVLEVFQSRLPG